MKFTPLSLACMFGWTEAVDILLRAGADLSDEGGSAPLLKATLTSSQECVALLLNHSSLEAWHVESVLARSLFFPNITPGQTRDAILQQLISAAASQRRSLLERYRSAFGSGKLPFSELEDDRVLDGKTLAIASANDSAWQSRYDKLAHDFKTVFHVCQSKNDAEILWRHGFRDIDGFDGKGLTPLMRQAYPSDEGLAYTTWLISKGAMISTRQRGTVFSAAQFLISKVMRGNSLHCCPGPQQPSIIIQNPPSVLVEHSSAPSIEVPPDTCECSCSVSGCTYTTTFMKRLKSYTSDHTDSNARCQCLWAIIDMWNGSDLFPSEYRRRVWISSLRSLLFDELSLTHTCCHYDEWGSDFDFSVAIEDASEIHEEEAEGIARLEELLMLAEEKLPSHGGTFSEFAKPFIKAHIWDESKSVDEDYVQSIRQLGVIVHE